MPFAQRKATICWPNLIDLCTLASDSSNYTRPLDRIQQRVLKDRAITTDTTFSITLTLDASRTVACVAAFSHNLSVEAQWRIRLYDAADVLLEDSGFFDVWPSLFQSYELAWENDAYWSGQPNNEDRSRFTAQASWFADRAWYCKKVVIDFTDDNNPDEFVELGRVFLGDAYQPDYNFSYGVQWLVDDSSAVDEALDRTEYFDEKTKVRESSMAFDWLSEGEAFARMFRLRNDVGITGEVFFAQQLVADGTYYQRSMLCRAASVDPVSHPDAARFTHALSFREII